jgi:hypothetical protein
LLFLENTTADEQDAAAREDDTYATYYSDVVGAVVVLRDIRSLNALLPLMNRGNMVINVVASFGPVALDAVLDRAKSDDETVRTGVLLVLKRMLAENNPARVTDPLDLERIRLTLDTLKPEADDIDAEIISDNVSSLTLLDHAPPLIAGTRSPAANVFGWNNTYVAVTFQCSDAISGLAPGSPPLPRFVTSEGADQSVVGTCTDLARNSASVTIQGISIDLTPPTVTIGVTAPILWPPNGKLVSETISGVIADGLSGINPSTATFTVVDEYEQIQPTGPIVLGPGGAYSFTLNLEASRRGQDRDGRTYRIIITATDKAGNQASATTVVRVPHDQGG